MSPVALFSLLSVCCWLSPVGEIKLIIHLITEDSCDRAMTRGAPAIAADAVDDEAVCTVHILLLCYVGTARFEWIRTLVTASTPLMVTEDSRDAVAAVVGLQMTYNKFYEFFVNATRFCPRDFAASSGTAAAACNLTCESPVTLFVHGHNQGRMQEWRVFLLSSFPLPFPSLLSSSLSVPSSSFPLPVSFLSPLLSPLRGRAPLNQLRGLDWRSAVSFPSKGGTFQLTSLRTV